MYGMRIEKGKKIWYEWKTIARLYLIILKPENIGTSCIMCAHALGIPLLGMYIQPDNPNQPNPNYKGWVGLD